MANETTTTSLNDFVNSALVEPTVIFALSEKPGLAMRLCREFNGIGKPTNAITLPTETSFWGTPADDGASIDTGFNATEGTALSNTQFTSGVVTLTAAEYGVAAALTDTLTEDSVLDGLTLLNMYMGRMLHVLTLAIDDDYLALPASLANSVGTSGSNLTSVNMLAAAQGIRRRGATVENGRLVYVLDVQQAEDLEGDLVTTNAAAAVYALSADRIFSAVPTSNGGLGDDRQFLSFRGNACISTGLTDTANTAADVAGMCVTPTSPRNDALGSTTHGILWKRLPTFKTQYQAKGRSNDLVMTARCGVGETQDGSGAAIITDA